MIGTPSGVIHTRCSSMLRVGLITRCDVSSSDPQPHSEACERRPTLRSELVPRTSRPESMPVPRRGDAYSTSADRGSSDERADVVVITWSEAVDQQELSSRPNFASSGECAALTALHLADLAVGYSGATCGLGSGR